MFGWLFKKENTGKMVRAVRKGDVATVKQLLAKGCNPDEIGLLGFALLSEAAREGHLEVARALIAAGANVNHSSGSTALHEAAKVGHEEMVKLLLQSGAVVDRPDDPYYYTPLMYAALYGNAAVVKLLLAAGADVGLVDSKGQSAVYHAAALDSPECVQLLIEAGCNPAVRNRTGETPLGGVDSGNFYKAEVAYELIAGGASLEPYEVASTQGPPTRYEYNLDRQNERGVTVLMVAACKGNANVVRRLLAKNVDVNKTNKEGKTALQLAQAAGHAEIVSLLQEAGAR